MFIILHDIFFLIFMAPGFIAMFSQLLDWFLLYKFVELPAGIEPATSRLWATSGNHYTRRIGICFFIKTYVLKFI
jgi:hypothetical protein